jgi:peptidoglycan hydrolase CwlO-like protein
MNLCSEDHDEICFDGRNCPLCELKKETEADKEDLSNQIDDLKGSIETLEESLNNAEDRLNEAKEGLLLLKGEEIEE